MATFWKAAVRQGEPPQEGAPAVSVRTRRLAASGLVILVGLTMFVIEAICLRVGLPGTTVTPVWVASGVGLAAVLLFGRRALIGIYIGSVLAQMTAHTSLQLSLILDVTVVIEPLIAATALTYFAGCRCDFLRMRDTAVLLVFGAGVAAGVSAAIGATMLMFAYHLSWSAFGTNFLTWWLGDVAGLILVTPLIMYFVRLPYERPTPRRIVESLLLVGLIAAVGYASFSGTVELYVAATAEYVIFTLLMWTAFRFGPRLTMLATNMLAVIAIIATVDGRGPFMRPTLNGTLLYFQASMSVLGVAALIMATIVSERREALRAVESARDDLEVKVRERTMQLEELATHDPLTALLNRRAFTEHLQRAISQAHRGRASALLYLDIDHFKEFNDSRGHAFGDTVLIEVAKILAAEARENDIVARLGGDEFTVLVDGADVPEAQAAGERMRLGVEKLSSSLGGNLSVSGGTVVVDGSLDVEGLLKAVDETMVRRQSRRPRACARRSSPDSDGACSAGGRGRSGALARCRALKSACLGGSRPRQVGCIPADEMPTWDSRRGVPCEATAGNPARCLVCDPKSSAESPCCAGKFLQNYHVDLCSQKSIRLT